MKIVKIEVIGSGCKKCEALFKLTKEVAQELSINDTVLYSTDVNKIAAMGLMSSPVLTIDDKPVLVGMLPNKDKLKDIIYKNVFNESAKIEIPENKAGGCCSCGGTC
ncbi:MAG TPA: thioredoxin family protein [Candidatus Paceibacterota bacterium]